MYVDSLPLNVLLQLAGTVLTSDWWQMVLQWLSEEKKFWVMLWTENSD